MSTQDQDIRWEQRFSNFKKAFSQLEKFIAEEERSSRQSELFDDGK